MNMYRERHVFKPRQNTCRFANDISKHIFFNKNHFVYFDLNFTPIFPRDPTNSKSALVDID